MSGISRAHRSAVVALALAASAGVLTPLAQTQDPQLPPFRAAVNVVRVDVSVSDRSDRAVENLRAEEFELREDGVLQRVDSAQFVRMTGARTSNRDESLAIRSQDHAESEAARDDVRVFVIFLDDYHVDKDQRLTLRVKQAISDLVKQFGPNDLVAIMDPLTPMSALRFTRSREDLLERVNKFEGRRGELHPVKSLLEEAQALRNDVWTVRGAVTLTALEGLVTYLGGLREGRKSVLFVSQGPAMGRDMDNQFELEAVLKAANHGNVTINAFDPRPLGSGPFSGAYSIQRLAQDTGGRAVTNSNAPGERLSQTVEDASAYYLLGYTPSRDFADGKFHKIEVKVRRSGMRVTARSGYWAASAAEMKAAVVPPVPPAITNALTTMVEPRTGRVADVWVGASRGEAGRTRMTISWDPSGRPQTPPAQVEISPVDGGPKVAGADPRALAPPQTVPAGTAAVFELEPQTAVAFRIAVKSATGELLDRWDQKAAVPTLDGVELALSTPRFLRARSALEARQLAGGAKVVPAASRQFRVTDRVEVELDSYASGSGAPEITAQLQNARGERLMDLSLNRQATGALRASLPLSSLAPNNTYIVSIDAILGDRTAQDRVAFRIVP